MPRQDTPGPLTRSVQDAALVAAVLAGDVHPDPTRDGQPPHLTGIRIGVPRHQIACRPEFTLLIPMLADCPGRLARTGAAVVDPCDLPSADAVQTLRSSVFRAEFKAVLNAFLQDHDAPCGIGST